MKRLILAVAAFGFLITQGVAAEPERGPEPRPALEIPPLADSQDVIFLSAARPVRVRLVARLDGKPLADMWDAAIRKMFDACDRSRDGMLDEKEAKHLLSTTAFKSLLDTGFANPPGDAPLLRRMDLNEDGLASFAEVNAYYRLRGGSPFSMSVGVPENPNTTRITEMMFKLIDQNGDGKLSQDEVKASEKLMAVRDSDEDECLTVAELLPGYADVYGARRVIVNPVGGAAAPPAMTTSNARIFVVPQGQVAGTITQRILLAYEQDGDFELTRAEVGFDLETFTRLDANGNGRLDGEELDAWRAGPPDATVELSTGAEQKATVNGRDAEARGLKVTTADGRVSIRCGQQTLDFQAGSAIARQQVVRNVTKQTFSIPFTNAIKGKSFVEESDLANPQFQMLKAFFKTADLDDDGKLTREEFDQYFDVHTAVAELSMVSSHAVQVPSLFQLLDGNKDGRLSIREMRTAWERLKPLEADGDFITKTAIQPGVQIRLLRGAERAYAAYNPDQFNAAVRAPLTAPVRGPIWFRKMDRNADGDISRVEFLGTKAEFDAIDADRDSLIGLEEATAFEEKQRPAGKK